MTGVWACSEKTGGGSLARSIALCAAMKVRMVAMVIVMTASHDDTAVVVITLHQCDPMWRKSLFLPAKHLEGSSMVKAIPEMEKSKVTPKEYATSTIKGSLFSSLARCIR